MTDFTIFHYHLLAGGVTNVIQLSVIALFRYYPDPGKITLVCGKQENTDKLVSKIHAACPESAGKITVNILPEIDYSDKKEKADPKTVIKKLRGNYSNSLWIIHNYHLGKNPLFTEAVLRTAAKYPDQKIIFYIHDFPECSRYSNLEKLLKVISSPAYPVLDNVRYLLINGRDRKYLIDSGIPEDMVFLVDNPVTDNTPGTSDSYIADKLVYFNNKDFGHFNPDNPLVLYPVRSIRRKNILEAVFINKLNPSPVNLLITLPGISKTEARYSESIRAVFSNGHTDGLFAFGAYLDKAGITFPELFGSADLIFSSSVQEGFGYLFIDSVKNGIPLFARYLEIINGFIDFFPENCTHFYRKIEIPLDKKLSSNLYKWYSDKISKLISYLSKKDTDKLKHQLDLLCSGEFIDFSFLPVQLQLDYITNAHNSEILTKEYYQINKITIQKMNNLLSSTVPYIDTESRFGLEKYSSGILEITESFKGSRNLPDVTGDSVQKNLLAKFASLEYLRLLYDWM